MHTHLFSAQLNHKVIFDGELDTKALDFSPVSADRQGQRCEAESMGPLNQLFTVTKITPTKQLIKVVTLKKKTGRASSFRSLVIVLLFLILFSPIYSSFYILACYILKL